MVVELRLAPEPPPTHGLGSGPAVVGAPSDALAFILGDRRQERQQALADGADEIQVRLVENLDRT
jgi:hypothetical protein